MSELKPCRSSPKCQDLENRNVTNWHVQADMHLPSSKAEDSPSCARHSTRQCHPVWGQKGPPGNIPATEPKTLPRQKLTTPRTTTVSHTVAAHDWPMVVSAITEGAILSSRYATLQLKLAAISRGCSLIPENTFTAKLCNNAPHATDFYMPGSLSGSTNANAVCTLLCQRVLLVEMQRRRRHRLTTKQEARRRSDLLLCQSQIVGREWERNTVSPVLSYTSIPLCRIGQPL
jgi:hypothetical protein